MKIYCGSFLMDHEVLSPQARLYSGRSKKREGEEEQINDNDNNQTRPSLC